MKPESINKKIDDIFIYLNSYTHEQKTSLYVGKAGTILFKTTYLDKDKDRDVADDVRELITDISNSSNPNFTFCGGVGGGIWLLNHLCIKNHITLTQSYFDDIDEYFGVIAQKYLEYKNYDFLHGAGGIILNLLARPEKNHALITQLIQQLLSIRINYKGHHVWRFFSYNKEEKDLFQISLGLSHGLPSLMVLLAKCYHAGILKKECLDAISECYSFIQLYRNPNQNKDNYAYFPSKIIEGEQLSYRVRIGWCYGDIGIGSALFTTGRLIDNQEYIDLGIEIYTYYATKPNQAGFGIIDAQFCHGAAGVAHMYHRMYTNTKINAFLSARDYWVNQTMDFANHNDGILGYKSWYGEKDGWMTCTGLLEGIAGIGLVLSSISKASDISWDECFLLS